MTSTDYEMFLMERTYVHLPRGRPSSYHDCFYSIYQFKHGYQVVSMCKLRNVMVTSAMPIARSVV